MYSVKFWHETLFKINRSVSGVINNSGINLPGITNEMFPVALQLVWSISPYCTEWNLYQFQFVNWLEDGLKDHEYTSEKFFFSFQLKMPSGSDEEFE